MSLSSDSPPPAVLVTSPAQKSAVLNGGCSSTSTKAVKRAMLSREVILKIFDSEATQGRESSSFRCAAQKATQAGVPQL